MAGEAETRVQAAVQHLVPGLTPFVAAHMKKAHGEHWLQYASRAQGSDPKSPLDAYGLLKTIIDNWQGLFGEAFSRSDRLKVRTFASIALEARNAVAHLALPMQDDEALRYLDAIHQLLRLTKAPEKEVSAVKALYDAQRSSGVAAAPAIPASQMAPKATLADAAAAMTVPSAAAPETTGRGLKPWISVALPHPDVLANRFKEAEFAADLFAVDSGNASEDYATPENFYRITFLTEGLKRVLLSALQRLGGSGGDPVIGLQTAFGGGKTHTMLALLHLARATDPKLLEGVAPLLEQAGIATWRKPKLAVFVGTAAGPDVAFRAKGAPRIRTLWGYIAWRLAGSEGLELVKDAEENGTNPGSDLMVQVFKKAGPSLILLDEVVAFARQLPDERFEAFLSFIQSLTEAAKMAPGVLVVGSLPESAVEAGGEKGVAALKRLEAVFGRVHSSWLPASGDETYQIIRRRLFQALDADGEKARDETVKAFADLYRKNPAEFPPETREPRYVELLKLAYPIHPELFRCLSQDWAQLQQFQRTRGVLRFMANVIGVLWHERATDPLITPARVPIGHEKIRASALYPLPAAFTAVVDREVDGASALPQQMEVNPSRTISRLRAATRAARAVFLLTAPLEGQANAGITGPKLRLACAEPGDQLAIFGDALRELSERAAFLYEEGGRYWFATKPTLNRLAEEKAKEFPEHVVDAGIVQQLRTDSAVRGGFHRVFAAPDDPAAVDESDFLALVILGPDTPHVGRTAAASKATEAATDALNRCRAGQRRFRNTLLFVAADEGQLTTAREVMRKALAWQEIVADKHLREQMTHGQSADAEQRARSAKEAAEKAVRAAWTHVLYPYRDAAATGAAFELQHLTAPNPTRAAIPSAVYDKAKADGVVKEVLGPEALTRLLEPLWPQDRPHLGIGELAEWFASYVYLPKVRDRIVLDRTIREAVTRVDPAFGYADAWDELGQRYVGLAWGKAPPDLIPAGAVLVRKDVALEQLRREAAVSGRPEVPTPGTPSSPGAPTTPEPQSPAKPGRPKRFYGTVEIDMMRPIRAFESIINSVVSELQRTPGAKVKVTVEIEATAPDGFPEEDVGVVRDNARQLKFKAESTGFEE